MLGQQLLEGDRSFADSWNFGPINDEEMSVEQILKKFLKIWPSFKYTINNDPTNPYEASILKLDCSKAVEKLGWKPVWSIENAVDQTGYWYKEYIDRKKILTRDQIHQYVMAASDSGAQWI